MLDFVRWPKYSSRALQEEMTFTDGSSPQLLLLHLSDVCARFLGPRMVYTSGIINDLSREETLEELQDNKLTVVCEKVCPSCATYAAQFSTASAAQPATGRSPA